MTMTELEQEIARAKKAHAAKMARLRRKAANEQKRIDAKVVELLRQNNADLYAELENAARDELAGSPTRRTRSAPTSVAAPAPAPLTADPWAHFSSAPTEQGASEDRDGFDGGRFA